MQFHYTYRITNIIYIFDTRKKALDLEIKLHNFFNIALNEHFYNKVKQTSTGFDTTGKCYMTEEQLLQKSIAWKENNPNNYCDRSGENNGMYGSARFGELNPFYRKTHTQDSKDKISKANTGRTWNHTQDSKDKISKANTGRVTTQETKNKISKILQARPFIQCPYCEMKSKSSSNMNRYHFENCKLKP